MKISIQVVPGLKETEFSVTCGALTPEIEAVIAALRTMDHQLTVKDGETVRLIPLYDILYVEAVDRKTFVYTADKTYETGMKLYEFELATQESAFVRVSKSCLVNLRKICALKAEFERRILVTMENGEQIMVSRMYADGLRERLGVK